MNWYECNIGRPDELREQLDDDVRERYEPFDVYGSGLLFVGRKAGSKCGKAENGIAIAVSFSKYGATAGVLDHAEAKRLADHIYAVLSSNVSAPKE